MDGLGNRLIAVRDYGRVAAEAAGISELIESHAELLLGILLRRCGTGEKARRHLERAETRAILLNDADVAFRAHYHLAELARERGDGTAKRHLKGCLRYWPLVHVRTPEVVNFEQLLRAGEVR
jgi:hypothetical protein